MSTAPDPKKPLLGGLRKSGSNLQELLSSLQRLDRLLQRAVAAAQNAYGPGAGADAYRGLYINQEEAESLLARKPGVSVLWSEREAEEPSSPPDLEDARLAWLKGRPAFRARGLTSNTFNCPASASGLWGYRDGLPAFKKSPLKSPQSLLT